MTHLFDYLHLVDILCNGTAACLSWADDFPKLPILEKTLLKLPCRNLRYRWLDSHF